MRKLNVKLAAVLIVAALALAGITHVVHGVQVKRSEKALLAHADRAEKQGELTKAEGYLERYLGYVPDDVQAQERFVRMLDRRARGPQERRRVMAGFERVLQLDDGRKEVRRRLVELAMDPQMQQHDDARDSLAILLRDMTDDKLAELDDPSKKAKLVAERGELEDLMGQCEEAAGKFKGPKGAIEWYTKAVTDAPDRVETYVRLAALRWKRGDDPAGADRVMADLVAKNAGSFRAFLAGSGYEAERGHRETAAAYLERARKLAPDEVDVLLASAEAALARADIAEARSYLERAAKPHPQGAGKPQPSDARVYQALAELEARAGRPDKAIETLNDGLTALPEDDKEPDVISARMQLDATLALILIQNGRDQGQLEPVIKRLEGKIAAEVRKYLNAGLDMVNGRWDRAIDQLEGLEPDLAANAGRMGDLSGRVYLALGRCYEQRRAPGDPERRYSAYRRAVNLDSEGVLARMGLAGSLAALKKTDEAIGEYRRVAPVVPRAWFAVVQLMRDRDKPRWDEIDLALQGAKAALPPSVDLTLLEASVALKRPPKAGEREGDGAIRVLREAIKAEPDQVKLWIVLADLVGRQGKPEAFLGVLDEAQGRLGDRAELRLARMGYWAGRGGDDASQALAKLVREDDKFSDDQRRMLQRGLAAAYTRIGALDEAERIWSLLAKRPEDLESQVQLFDLALKAGNEDAMRRIAKEIRRIEGDVKVADGRGKGVGPFAEAGILIWRATRRGDKSGLGQARTLLAEAASRRPNWGRVAAAEAEIDELEGRRDDAIRNFEKAVVTLKDGSPYAIRRLVQLLHEKGQDAKVEEVLRGLQAQGADLASLTRQAVADSFGVGDYDRALELAERAVPDDSKAYKDQVWLGLVRWSSAQSEESRGQHEKARELRAKAERSLRRAVELAPDQPDAWTALVGFLARSGQKPAAETAFRKAEKALERRPLDLARCAQALGDPKRAEERYMAALKADPQDVRSLEAVCDFYLSDNRAPQAEPYLERLAALKDRDPAAASRVRQTLAVLKAARGDWPKAYGLLGLSADDAANDKMGTGETPDDQRTKAKVLASRPVRASRHRAITVLEDLIAQASPSPEDRYLLAQLYDSDGKKDKAGEQYLTLLPVAEKTPSYPTFLAAYVNYLLRLDRYDEAQTWWKKLDALVPEGFPTVALRARILNSQGKGAEAAGLLTKYAQGKEAPIGNIANQLAQMDRPVEAEAMYRQFAARSSRPDDDAFSLAGFLARQGRLKEALDLCERHAKAVPPGTLAAASVALLYQTAFDEAQGRRVEGWIEAASRKDPQSLGLRFQMANLRVLQGRYDEAGALYRQANALDPKQPGPLNNWALLLALKGKAAEAEALVGRAEALVGPTPNLLDTRAVVYLKAGKADQAIRDLEQVVEIAPSGPAYFHLAQARKEAGDLAGAATAFREAIKRKLKPHELHPLEQAAYRQFGVDMASK